jgi:hypothetical protein
MVQPGQTTVSPYTTVSPMQDIGELLNGIMPLIMMMMVMMMLMPMMKGMAEGFKG